MIFKLKSFKRMFIDFSTFVNLFINSVIAYVQARVHVCTVCVCGGGLWPTAHVKLTTH